MNKFAAKLHFFFDICKKCSNFAKKIQKMKRLYLLLAGMCACLGASSQALPKVGEPSADDFIVRIAQSGWRTEGASLTYDGRTLYLSVKKSPREVYDLYVAKKENGRWQMPTRLDFFSTDGDEWSPSVASDEQTIYFVRREVKNPGTKKETIEQNMYSSVRLPDGTWQEPQQMIVSSGRDSKLRLMADNVTLYYCVEPSEKNGLVTYYVIQKLDKYNWTLPQEVAPDETARGPITSVSGVVKNEKGTPLQARIDVYNALTQRRVAALQTDEKGAFRLALIPPYRYMLDFNSEGYSHVYKWVRCAEMENDVEQTEDVVLSHELNIRLCTYDAENMARIVPDISVRDGETGKPLASVMEKGNRNDYSLHLPIGKDYQFTMRRSAYADTTFRIDTRRDVRFDETELDMLMRVGKVLTHVYANDSETGEPIVAGLTITNLTTEDVPQTAEVGTTGYHEQLRCNTRYRLAFSTPGYLFKDTVVDMPAQEGDVDVRISQVALRQAVVVQLRNIQFEYNSYLLKEDSYVELEKVAELLRQNPTLRIEISAHTDDKGSDVYNKKLSNKRAQSAVEYLVEIEGVDAGQLEWKGYGKERPLVPNDSEENRALNRRVEFSILDI